MANDKDEIDLIDLLGVLIKRRSFIIWFIVLFTFVTTSVIFVKEYIKTSGSKKIYTSEFAVSVSNDPIYVSYSYLKKNSDLEDYKKTLSSILFPAGSTPVNFEIQVQDDGSIDYFFDSKQDLDSFVKTYSSMMDNISNMYLYNKAMKPEIFASCRQLYVSRASNISVKDLFNDSEELRFCNLFNYYLNIVQGKFTYSIENLKMDDSFISFITDYMDKNHKDYRLVSNDIQEDRKLKLELKRQFNKKKVLKYTILLFILSVMLSFASAYLIEFWTNNKSRLKKYWKN